MNTYHRIDYLDALKFIAIFSIIIIHASLVWQGAMLKTFYISSFSEFFRMGVPIFLMVSGTLLLNKKYDLESFLKKRFKRIIYPFIFWAIIFAIAILILFTVVNSPHALEYLGNFPLEFCWYFWMILGVYLAIPILNEFIRNLKLKGAEYFVIIFIIASLFYQVLLMFNISTFIDLRFFLGPIGYIVLGYYLSQKEFNISPNKIIIISIVLYLITSILKVNLHLIPTDMTHLIIADNNLHILSFMDCNILEIIQASAVFLIIKNIYSINIKGMFKTIKSSILENKQIKKFILSISKASYGMYLSNILFIGVSYEFLKEIPQTGTQVAISVILLSIGILLASWILILILDKIPYIKKVIGYH